MPLLYRKKKKQKVSHRRNNEISIIRFSPYCNYCFELCTFEAFYIDILGTKKLNETYRAERDSYKLDLSFPDGSQIELFSFPNPPQRVTNPEACGLRHLAFQVENIDEYVAYLLENSIDCEPIRVDELTGMKYTFFRDPDYLPIELYENNY